jgi:hypothetical protein
MKIVPVILSGGSGTRLWPLSFLSYRVVSEILVLLTRIYWTRRFALWK